MRNLTRRLAKWRHCQFACLIMPSQFGRNNTIDATNFLAVSDCRAISPKNLPKIYFYETALERKGTFVSVNRTRAARSDRILVTSSNKGGKGKWRIKNRDSCNVRAPPFKYTTFETTCSIYRSSHSIAENRFLLLDIPKQCSSLETIFLAFSKRSRSFRLSNYVYSTPKILKRMIFTMMMATCWNLGASVVARESRKSRGKDENAKDCLRPCDSRHVSVSTVN